MAAQGKKCAVIVCGDADPNLLSDHAPPMGLNQATAAIVLLNDEAKGRLGTLQVSTDYDIEQGLVRFTRQSEGDTFVTSAGTTRGPCELEKMIVEVVQAALSEASLNGKDVDLVLVPGPAEPYRCVLGRNFQISPDKIIAPKTGKPSAFSADLVAALREARALGQFKKGQVCLFLGFSDVGEVTCLHYQA